jgi:hypothetical protein
MDPSKYAKTKIPKSRFSIYLSLRVASVNKLFFNVLLSIQNTTIRVKANAANKEHDDQE